MPHYIPVATHQQIKGADSITHAPLHPCDRLWSHTSKYVYMTCTLMATTAYFAAVTPNNQATSKAGIGMGSGVSVTLLLSPVPSSVSLVTSCRPLLKPMNSTCDKSPAKYKMSPTGMAWTQAPTYGSKHAEAHELHLQHVPRKVQDVTYRHGMGTSSNIWVKACSSL